VQRQRSTVCRWGIWAEIQLFAAWHIRFYCPRPELSWPGSIYHDASGGYQYLYEMVFFQIAVTVYPIPSGEYCSNSYCFTRPKSEIIPVDQQLTVAEYSPEGMDIQITASGKIPFHTDIGSTRMRMILCSWPDSSRQRAIKTIVPGANNWSLCPDAPCRIQCFRCKVAHRITDDKMRIPARTVLVR